MTDQWLENEAKMMGMDPFDFDYNADDLINNDKYLQEPATKLHLQVESVKRQDEPEKTPRMAVTFRVCEGPHMDKIIKDYFYGTEKARWRIRELVVACGFYTYENRDGKRVQAVHQGKTIRDCVGQTLYADAIREASNEGKFYTRVKNMEPEQ